jgi:hypothetical protein
MGADLGKIEMKLNLSKFSITAGEPLIGSLSLKTEQDLPDADVILIFTGKEKYSGSDNKGTWDQRKTFVVYNLFTLYSTHGTILRQGEYSFPFAIKTSDLIPGTFCSNETRTNYATIGYSLRSKLTINKKKILKKHKLPIKIRQNFKADRYAKFLNNIGSIKSFGKFGQENYWIGIHLNKNDFFPGESACVRIGIENPSSRPNDEIIEVKIFRTFTFERSGDWPDLMCKKELFSVRKTITFNNQRLSNEKNVTGEILIEFQKEYFSSAPSIIGKTIKCMYEMGFYNNSEFYTSSKLIALVPLIIYAQENESVEPFVPQEWDSTQVPLTSLDSNQKLGSIN